MGAKDSKPSCISYDDAVKRVSDSEIRRIKDAFKKSAGAGGTTLSKNAFLQDVLSEGVPPVLADWLYGACGGQQRGIAFKELFCGLVLLTRGTPDEKIKFLWNVYCNDSSTHIIKSDFARALQIEVTYQPTANPIACPTAARDPPHQSLSHTSILISLFGQSDRVTYDQFKAWISGHKRVTVLSKWLLVESGVTQLSTELETPTFFQSLAGVTHLEEQDIVDLEKVFWLLKGSGQLDLETLGALISPPVPWAALVGVFLAFDENRDGHIDFKELCCGVSAACRGPSVERSKFCFKVFDIDGDGVLSYAEIQAMVNVLIFVAGECNNSSSFAAASAAGVLQDLRMRGAKSLMGLAAVVESSSSAESAAFSLTQEDFMMWSVQSTVNLVQPFLDLLFEVCHVVLGLRPQCRHLEYDIVKGWLAREESRGYRVGQFWYLISSEWYNHWLQYTQSSGSAMCSFCKSSTHSNHQRQTSAVDEAVVCDESFTSNSTESMGDLLSAVADSSSLGSGSSGISMGRSSHSPPGMIDNNNLIAPSNYKNVPTLTGEGGRLKRDLLLVQHRDYELVPESLWKALAQWYKGPLPLPRQVIQPPNSPDVELELYPLNIRIMRHQPPPAVQQAPVSTWGAVPGGYGAMTSSNNYAANTSSSGAGSVSTAALQPPKRYLAYMAAFSRLATVRQVTEFLCQRLKLKFEDIRLWHESCLLEEEEPTLHDLMIADNDQFLLEIRNKDLTWPEELGSLALSNGSAATGNSGFGGMDRRATLASIQSVHAPGATGLHNLGNTCFMNSALQVLFNTQPLTQYFKQNMHLYELNTANKLGTKGQLALRYSELLKEVWTAQTRSVAPLKLRFCMTKHAPQFAGGGQHDSQELLEWLLDALHEDLNRVTEKPYSELKDSDGRADCVVAAEAWQQHHARNQSIVIDLFYGQLKSKVSCLGCGRDSVRFDPFSLLSLPLPVENYTYCEVLVILLDGTLPTKYGLRLNSESRYIDLKTELSVLCHLDASLMLVCELLNSQIRCTLMDGQKLKVSSAVDLYVYEVPVQGGEFWRPRTSSELGMNIENGLKDIQRNPALLLMPQSAHDTNIIHHHQSTHNNNCHHQLTTSSAISSSSTMSSSPSDDMVPLNKSSPEGSVAKSAASLATGINGGFSPNTLSGVMSAERSAKHSTELSTSPESTFVHMRRRSSVAANLLTLKEANSGVSADTQPNQSATDTATSPLDCSASDATSTKPPACASTTEMSQPRLQRHSLDSLHHFHHGSFALPLNKISENGDDADDDERRDVGFETDEASADKADQCGCEHTEDMCDQMFAGDHRQHQQFDSASTCDSIENISVAAQNRFQRGLSGGDSPLMSSPRRRKMHIEPGSGNGGVGGYLIAVHRKLSRQDTYFLSYHKTRPSLFGVPLLIPCYEGGSNKDLYCAVWMQVARLLSPLPSTPPDQLNHATDCDDSLGYEFPFTLRAVSEGGRVCALCPWSKFCRGCEIPCNDDPLLKGSPSSTTSSTTSTPNLSSRDSSLQPPGQLLPTNRTNIHQQNQPSGTCGISFGGPVDYAGPVHTGAIHIAIDWDPTALHLRYQSTREKLWTEHESVGICRRQQTEPVDLNHCLRAFTSEEKLEQWYHCAHCKGKKPATKKLQIWKLPPILIIHLKRFNFVNNRWVKSQKVVNFPFKDFDPTPYLASVPQETILRHKELLDHQQAAAKIQHKDQTHSDEDEVYAADRSPHHHPIESIQESSGVGAAKDNDKSVGAPIRAVFEHDPRRRSVTNHNGISPTKRGGAVGAEAGETGTARRKRLVSTSLTKTPVIDGEFTDFHNHRLTEDEDPYNLNYQLYAVVSHSGMLNGGHYISYASHPNSSWYCFNDSSCREIPNQPHIDPSSAYLLFYERKGLNYPPYLPKVSERTVPNGTPVVDIDDVDPELRKTCSIS